VSIIFTTEFSDRLLGVVVANRHREELSILGDTEHVYFAERPHAWVILEAVEHYDFLNL
jgi:sucrose-phosphate synthase